MDNNLTSIVRKFEENQQLTEAIISSEETEDTIEKTEDIIESHNIKITEADTITLTKWYEQNHNSFDKINCVHLAIRGIDSNENIIFSVLNQDETRNEKGERKRELFLWKNTHLINILDLPGSGLKVCNSAIQITYKIENAFVKCYIAKTNLLLVSCIEVENQLIPYHIMKLEKRPTKVQLVAPPDTNIIQQKLSLPINREDLVLQYKQISKDISKINTYSDAVNWFLQRQQCLDDVLHILQIDKIILWMFNTQLTRGK
jgi:hypothetical protein